MRVFISGISGSLGTALARLHHSRGDRVFGCSRNETRAVQWIRDNGHLGTLFLGDCNQLLVPLSDMRNHLSGCDVFYHCAALKAVELAEMNPSTAYLQNVVRTMEMTEICTGFGVPLVLVSSDKACLPTSVYGATKLLAEKMVLRAGGSVVRLGNLIGSSGSVFEKWQQAAREGREIEITDPAMTRFFIPISEAAAFLASQHLPGSIVFPKMRAIRMGEVASHLRRSSSASVRVVGIRPGETLHQWIAAPDDFVKSEGERRILGEGERMAAGLSSEYAPQWDAGELLEAAGLRS